MFMLNPKLYEEAFPINKVEVFFDALDHSNFLGFKWQQVGKGRVPVGLDTSDSDFNTVGKMGGEKTHKLTINEMPSHTHSTAVTYPYVAGGNHTCTPNSNMDRTGTAWDVVDKTGGDESHNNLQPYIVMAFWKRIA